MILTDFCGLEIPTTPGQEKRLQKSEFGRIFFSKISELCREIPST